MKMLDVESRPNPWKADCATRPALLAFAIQPPNTLALGYDRNFPF
jgi:hypothetical protein